MPVEKQNSPRNSVAWLLNIALGFPWLEIFSETWKVLRALSRGLADEGIYEVLEYETTLELCDTTGEQALFTKRQRVRYLQNDIIAYQDQAWGDGDILIDYRCTPGVAVDKHRPGQKTYILISLRAAKQRGEEDEFRIEWRQKNGFVRDKELWETEVSHRTRHLKIAVIFPQERPPHRTWLVEQMRRRTIPLHDKVQSQLPDGRWRVQWTTHKPRLQERYGLGWEW